MKITTTQRGFEIAKFKDQSGRECSIQKSSDATRDCIWLGYADTNDRMHLTVKQVEKLLPLLQNFVNTGNLTSHDKR